MSLLEVSGLTVAYGAVEALSEVSLSLREGVICVLGANGAGKSTLLKAIAGLVPVGQGKIVFSGEDIAGLPPYETLRRGITLCPEGRRLFPEMSVADNIRIGAYAVRDKAAIRTRLDMVGDLFPRLRERAGQLAGSLSGGEQQMAAIARALMSGPRLLMLDEPTLGLAPKLIHEVAGIVRSISAEGIGVVLVEQNARLALKLASYGYVLETGRLSLAGPAAALLDDDHVRRIYLGG
ncbi:MAG TPA: ABC transporter ATP-binding protein [Bosea sp. (in: a-proteobacteria)]|jgi:branched-chain amino acid transport system ATP-binding protein|nr:ABC transporter ATP-binding protein [Bosea sp. (in: a-proteobacteria)]HEV2512129.1 ABC transporter ATP-binding protein [Bosea sp. (in: a-proteobacteria)]